MSVSAEFRTLFLVALASITLVLGVHGFGFSRVSFVILVFGGFACSERLLRLVQAPQSSIRVVAAGLAVALWGAILAFGFSAFSLATP
jgi:hypothetical protein